MGGPPPQNEAAIISNDYDYEEADGFNSGAQSLSQGAGGASKNKIESPKVSIRAFFPETWLFTLTRPGYTRPGQINSVIEQKLTAPASITTWQADAFCVGLVRKLDLIVMD